MATNNIREWLVLMGYSQEEPLKMTIENLEHTIESYVNQSSQLKSTPVITDGEIEKWANQTVAKDGFAKYYTSGKIVGAKYIRDRIMPNDAVEFAEYSNTYYKLVSEIEPKWINKNNHNKYTSKQVYEKFQLFKNP